MASAAAIRIIATAKVIRIPAATASGRAVVMSVVADANTNTAPKADAPVMSPRFRERLSMPEVTPRWSAPTVGQDDPLRLLKRSVERLRHVRQRDVGDAGADEASRIALDAEGGNATQDALSRQMFVDRSNAGRAFKRLEQAGHVTRRKDEGDGRTNLIDITAQGRDAAAEIKRLGDEMARTFFGDLTEADARTIVQLLSRAL